MELMKAKKKLDLVLKWYYNNQGKSIHAFEDVSKATGLETDEIIIIVEKLVKLNYLSVSIPMEGSKYPYMNFDGVIFYENAFPCTNKPFKSKYLKNKLNLWKQGLITILLFAKER